MSAKFGALAQSIFGDNRLILIRAETEGGHGIGSARDLEVQEFADIFAFLEDRLGTNRALPSTMTGMAAASGKARSEEHTSELQSLMRISYAGFCLKNTQVDTQRNISRKRMT